MTSRYQLTGDDLARPAESLPLKVIRDISYKLHRSLQSSGNWETIAEELGYSIEEIKHFQAMSNVRQEVSPCELLLHDWCQRGQDRTLFVLHSALYKADRMDCIEFLEKEIFDKVVCMDLMICIKHMDGSATEHKRVRTQTDRCLLECLETHLQLPLPSNYRLLESGASWTSTLAREYKGRQLMIQKLSGTCKMEQDPTIDSSCPEYGASIQPASWAVDKSQQRRTSSYQMQETNWSHEQGIFCNQNWNQPRQHAVSRSGPSTARQGNTEESGVRNCASVLHHAFFDPATQSRSPDPRRGNFLTLSGTLPTNDLNTTWGNPKSHTNANCMNIKPTSTFSEDVNVNKRTTPGFLNSGNNETNKMDISQEVNNITMISSCTNSGHMTVNDICYQKRSNDRQYADDDTVENGNGNQLLFGHSENESQGEEFDPLDDAAECMSIAEYQYVSEYRDTEEQSIFPERRDSDGSETAEYRDPDEVMEPAAGTRNPNNNQEDGNEQITIPDYQLAKHIEADGSNDSITLIKQVIKVEQATGDSNNVAAGVNQRNSTVVRFSSDTIQRSDGFLQNDVGNRTDVGNTEFPDDAVAKADEVNRAHFEAGSVADAYYLDFNRYPQEVNVDEDSDNLRGHLMVDDPDYQGEGVEPVYKDSEMINMPECPAHEQFVKPSKPSRVAPLRFFSQIAPEPSPVQRDTPYETLHHQVSCPAEFEYSGAIPDNQPEHSPLPTLADVFSPLQEEFKLNDFQQNAHPSPNTVNAKPSAATPNLCGKRHSMPFLNRQTQLEKPKTFRHTMSAVHSSASSVSHLDCSHSSSQMEPLTSHSVTSRHPLSQKSNSVDSDRRSERLRSVEQNTGGMSRLSRTPHLHPYKLVVGGKTSRPSLDGLLQGDLLFERYNQVLKGFIGWSPRETENTVRRTMADTLNKNGYYILWYMRSKKNLILSISHNRTLINFCIHTKIVDNHMVYYIKPGQVFRDVMELLQFFKLHGVPHTVDKGGHQMRKSSEVLLMMCPVMVQYERQPAVSV